MTSTNQQPPGAIRRQPLEVLQRTAASPTTSGVRRGRCNAAGLVCTRPPATPGSGAFPNNVK